MIQWEKALKWEEESFSLLPSLPCFPLITTNNPLLSTLCVCVLGSPVVRPSGLGPGRKTSLQLFTSRIFGLFFNSIIGCGSVLENTWSKRHALIQIRSTKLADSGELSMKA